MTDAIDGNGLGKHYAMFNREPAWHKLGRTFTEKVTGIEAWREMSDDGKGFNYFELPVIPAIAEMIRDVESGLLLPYSPAEVKLQTNEHGEYEPVQSHKMIMRSDGRAIGMVGIDYALVQAHTVATWADVFEETGEAHLEAAGYLNEGRRMWMLYRLNDGIADVAKGDTVIAYLLVYTSFDGSLAHGIKFTATRVVCANTLAIALADGMKAMKFKHTKSIHLKLEDAKKLIDLTNRDFRKTIDVYQFLLSKKMSHVEQVQYVSDLFLTQEEQAKPEEISTRTLNNVQHVVDLLETQSGLELIPAIRGTAWQAYNAVTQYLTHDRGAKEPTLKNLDSRLNSQWFGDSAQFNNRALQALVA